MLIANPMHYRRDQSVSRREPIFNGKLPKTLLQRKFAPAGLNGNGSFSLSVDAAAIISGTHSTEDPFLQRGISIARYGIGTTRLAGLSTTDYARNVRDYWHATTNKRLS
jgi:hypothetical protein